MEDQDFSRSHAWKAPDNRLNKLGSFRNLGVLAARGGVCLANGDTDGAPVKSGENKYNMLGSFRNYGVLAARGGGGLANSYTDEACVKPGTNKYIKLGSFRYLGFLAAVDISIHQCILLVFIHLCIKTGTPGVLRPP